MAKLSKKHLKQIEAAEGVFCKAYAEAAPHYSVKTPVRSGTPASIALVAGFEALQGLVDAYVYEPAKKDARPKRRLSQKKARRIQIIVGTAMGFAMAQEMSAKELLTLLRPTLLQES